MRGLARKLILANPVADSKWAVSPWPLSCLALAGVLERAGWQVRILHQACEADWERFVEEHLPGSVCVGISAMTGGQIRSGLRIAEKVRRLAPCTPIVWGGPHPTSLPDETASDPRVDFVVRGEGEYTFLDLAERLLERDHPADVGGLTYRLDGRVETTPSKASITNLDELPPLPWHLVDAGKILRAGRRRSISVQTGRGCPMRCTFCSHKVMGAESRQFSPEWVLDNIEQPLRKYDIGWVDFYEPSFVGRSTRVARFCEGILRRGLRFSWSASARADDFCKLDKEVLALLRRSGCKVLTFGFESGSQRILERINKRITPAHIVQAVEACRRSGIVAESCFMVGLPFETLGDLGKTLRVVAGVKRSAPESIIHVQLYTAFPGSELYEECLRAYALAPPRTLEDWGRYEEWQDRNPWLQSVKGVAARLMNGSVYASGPHYLGERSDLRFRRLGHLVVAAVYAAVGAFR